MLRLFPHSFMNKTLERRTSCCIIGATAGCPVTEKLKRLSERNTGRFGLKDLSLNGKVQLFKNEIGANLKRQMNSFIRHRN